MTGYLPGHLPEARLFLEQFWQKKPLLARDVRRQPGNALDRARMIGLACRDDVESRLVIGARTSWRVEHGPFRKRDFAQLPPRNWTLLVNGLENILPAARKLQQMFSFIPYARHDDVMASYAVPGGSVGPHFDSYDVILLQTAGTRRWQISNQRDLALVEGAPLKILRRFRSQRAWTVHPGDLLYLPPRYAHHGVALDECITWSVGFRAPGRRDMTECFLDFLRDRAVVDRAYRDPGLKPQRHAAVIGKQMLRQINAMVKSIRWSKTDIERCLGLYLTEPRSNVVFGHARRVSASRFARLAGTRGVELNLKSRMLTSGNTLFINGESAVTDAPTRKTLQQLADQRFLPAQTRTSAATRALLYEWYRAGYIELGD
jgi:50S ribosomal protein L16 3-hydroxylase